MNVFASGQMTTAQTAQLDGVFGLAASAFAGWEKISELNMQALKSLVGESQEAATKLLAVKDLQSLLSLQASYAQPATEKAQSYWRHVHEIVAAAQGELTSAAQPLFHRAQSDAQGSFQSFLQSASPGGEAALSGWKSVFGMNSATVDAASDAIRTSATEAVSAAQADIDTVTSQSNAATQPLVVVEKSGRVEKK
jgi:phasin family protein